MAIHLRSLAISIFFFSLLHQLLAGFNFDSVSTCITPYNQSVSNQIDTTYDANLQTLFSNLASSSASSSAPYFNSTAGQPPSETAYGLYLCRGDVASDICRTCVKTLTVNLSSLEPLTPCKDSCMIHCGNYSFFGKSNNSESLLSSQPSKFSTTDVQEYNRTLQGVLKGAINDAAFNSTTLFTSRQASSGGGAQETVYALAQCSPDLDGQTCSGCLNAALVAVTNGTTSKTGIIYKSDTVLLPSCQLRYDNVSFSLATSNSPAVVSAFLLATWSLFFIHFLLA